MLLAMLQELSLFLYAPSLANFFSLFIQHYLISKLLYACRWGKVVYWVLEIFCALFPCVRSELKLPFEWPSLTIRFGLGCWQSNPDRRFKIYLFFLLFFPLKKIRITYNGLWCDLCDLEIVGSLGNDFIYNIVVILLMLPLPSPSWSSINVPQCTTFSPATSQCRSFGNTQQL